MAFHPKLIIFFVGCNTILARSYNYGYEPYKPFHVPWAIKYPQPLISIDGAWPISYTYPLPKDVDYSYEESNYQQELLVNSLNKALTKLNQLLPPSSSNLQETTTYPPSTKPEVLAEALNKAIDRLGVLLTRQPLPLNKPEVTTEVIVNKRQPTMPPGKVYESVNSAINDLSKLFATLPDELKAIPNQTPLTNNNNPVFEFQQMRPAPFLSKPLYPELNMIKKESTSEATLFTSNHLEENIVTEKVKEVNSDVESTTTIPNIAGNTEIPSRNSDENNIITTLDPIVETSSSVSPTENIDTTVLPTENNVGESTVLPTENNVGSTSLPIRDAETDMTTIGNDLSTIPLIAPKIDIRFNEKAAVSSDFLFPDQFDQMFNQNKKPTVDVASRFQEQQGPTAQSSTPITLEYKPSRPPFHPDIFPPNPSPRPQNQPNLQTSTNFELGDRNKETAPIQTKPQTDSNPQIATNFELFDTNKVSTVLPTQTQRPVQNNQNPQFVLDYKPSRPPFHPDVFPPAPTAKPQTDSSSFELGDRNKPATTTEIIFTTTQNNQPYHPTHYYSTPISLEYKPTRPFYVPNPVFYPGPIIRPGTPWPASSTERPKN